MVASFLALAMPVWFIRKRVRHSAVPIKGVRDGLQHRYARRRVTIWPIGVESRHAVRQTSVRPGITPDSQEDWRRHCPENRQTPMNGAGVATSMGHATTRVTGGRLR